MSAIRAAASPYGARCPLPGGAAASASRARGARGALEWQPDGRRASAAARRAAVGGGRRARRRRGRVLACDRLTGARRGRRGARRRARAGSLAAVLVAGARPSASCAPRRWGRAGGRGSRAARSRSARCGCPTTGADPWPRVDARAGGRAAAARWPRCSRCGRAPAAAAAATRSSRSSLLLVLVVSPVVSLGGTRPLLLGAALAALTRLLPVARAAAAAAGARGRRAARGRAGGRAAAGGARPTAASRGSTTRRSPRGSGPTTRCASAGRRPTGRSTGRATATRSLRVKSDRAALLEGARTSTPSTGSRWRERARATRRRRLETELPRGLAQPSRAGSTDRGRRSAACARTDVIGAGTILEVADATRPVRPSGGPGRWTGGHASCAAATPTRVEVLRPDADRPPTLRAADATGFRVERATSCR